MSQIELTAKEITPIADLPTGEMSVVVRPEVGVNQQPDQGAVVTVEGDDLLPSSSILSDPYAGAGSAPFPKEVQAVLRKYHKVPDEWIGIRPEGHIYLSYSHAVDVFDEAFGYGGWSLVPVGDQFQVERTPKADRNGKPYELVTLYREYRFYCLGRFVRQAMGAGDYRTNNPSMNLSDAAEMCESYALNRMAKRFRIAAQCWDSAYAEEWKAKYAYQDNGDWKKRKASAGAPAVVQPSTHPQEVPQTPQQTPSHAPADSKLATIHLSSKGKAWQYQGVKYATYKDTTGTSWKFAGDTIATADGAVERGREIEVAYRIEVEGKYKNKVVYQAAFTGGD